MHKDSGLLILEVPETTLDNLALAYDHFTRISSKYMWFFWGRTDEETRKLFGKSVTITGTKKSQKDAVPVFEGSTGIPNTDIPNNDKVARVPTSMTLPSAGLWRLDATVDGEYWGSVFVEVRE